MVLESYHQQARPTGQADTDPRLPRGMSVLVIGALSLFSWALVIEAGLALQSIF